MAAVRAAERGGGGGRRCARPPVLREKFLGYPATLNSADLTLTGEIFPSVGSKLTRRIPVAGAHSDLRPLPYLILAPK